MVISFPEPSVFSPCVDSFRLWSQEDIEEYEVELRELAEDEKLQSDEFWKDIRLVETQRSWFVQTCRHLFQDDFVLWFHMS